MIDFSAMNHEVHIDLEPGLYSFHPDTIGKTLLAKMVKSIGEKDKVAITYYDVNVLHINLDMIISRNPKLLILDRFDLYDEESAKLEALRGTDCVTIVDYKTVRRFCDFDDTCFVTLDRESLRVSVC